MAINFPGPYEVRFKYRVDVLEHTMKLNCSAVGSPQTGDLASTISLATRGGGNVNLVDAVNAWYSTIKGLWHTTTEFFDAELWKYTPNSFSSIFISAIPSATNGTNAIAYHPAGQQILTYRTREGGIMRLSLMETSLLGTQVESPPFANTTLNAVSNFLIGSTNWVLARDTSYPMVTLRANFGENEAIFKKRFRSTI